jgi:hypothetical protein
MPSPIRTPASNLSTLRRATISAAFPLTASRPAPTTPLDQWKVGADLNAVGSQYLIHDDTNVNQHYYLAGTFTNTGGFGPANNNNPNTLGTLSDPRTFVPGMPFAAYAGIKATF